MDKAQGFNASCVSFTSGYSKDQSAFISTEDLK